MFRFRFRPSYFALASSFFFNRSSQESKPTPVEIPSHFSSEPPYRHVNCTGFECIRESAMITLSSSSSFLKQTLYYYSELTQRYCIHITTMIGLLEEYQRREGTGNAQQEIWDIYVTQRVLFNEMKRELLRLRLLLTTIERLVNESIDAGYQTQDETVTQLVSNELINSKRLIEQNEQLITKNELLLSTEQVKLIGNQSEEKKTKNSGE